MFHLLCGKYKLPSSIFLASFIAFIFLNLIENYIHYNIGRNRENTHSIELSMPSKRDWIRIIVIMMIFAILQGGFTLIISRYI